MHAPNIPNLRTAEMGSSSCCTGFGQVVLWLLSLGMCFSCCEVDGVWGSGGLRYRGYLQADGV